VESFRPRRAHGAPNHARQRSRRQKEEEDEDERERGSQEGYTRSFVPAAPNVAAAAAAVLRDASHINSAAAADLTSRPGRRTARPCLLRRCCCLQPAGLLWTPPCCCLLARIENTYRALYSSFITPKPISTEGRWTNEWVTDIFSIRRDVHWVLSSTTGGPVLLVRREDGPTSGSLTFSVSDDTYTGFCPVPRGVQYYLYGGQMDQRVGH
jgi:transposase